MNQDFAIPVKKFLLIPPGTYRAIINSVEKTAGNYGPQVKLIFHVITDGEGLEYTEGFVDLVAWTSANYSERSKLFRWTRAALAGEFNPDADFVASSLINKRVLISVEKYESANGGEYNRVIDVMGAPKSRSAKPAPAPQAQTAQQEPLPPIPEPPPDDLPW
jgi:hypothetical protein